jgi:hypothetical protein
MLKKLEIDALKADIASIDAMLTSRTVDDDPIGYFQYSARRDELLSSLQRIGDAPETHAEVGLFFGGAPVQGARGIYADFAGQVLDDYQALVSKRYCSREIGQLGTRGPVPQSGNSQLMITGTVRGSFGFVLEEAGSNNEILETPLMEVVEEISDILSRVGAEDETIFDEAAAVLDERTLVTLKQFFQKLDDGGATLRVVQGARDFLLDRQSISLARARTQALEIEDQTTTYIGTLFLLPDSRRFDFYIPNNDGSRLIMKGTVSQAVIRQLEGQPEIGQPPIDARSIPQGPWRVEIRTREIRERSRTPRKVHTLMRLVNKAEVT